MVANREKALVGLFVVVAGALLFASALVLTGGIGASRVPHSAFFKFSGGLEPGASVRYAGLNVGKVTRVQVDPRDTTRIEVDFAVDPDTPLRTDMKRLRELLVSVFIISEVPHFVRNPQLHTGLTRGKKLVVLIGQKKALGMAVRNDRTQRRYSELLERRGRRRSTPCVDDIHDSSAQI